MLATLLLTWRRPFCIDWIRTQRAAVASRCATSFPTHASPSYKLQRVVSTGFQTWIWIYILYSILLKSHIIPEGSTSSLRVDQYSCAHRAHINFGDLTLYLPYAFYTSHLRRPAKSFTQKHLSQIGTLKKENADFSVWTLSLLRFYDYLRYANNGLPTRALS